MFGMMNAARRKSVRNERCLRCLAWLDAERGAWVGFPSPDNSFIESDAKPAKHSYYLAGVDVDCQESIWFAGWGTCGICKIVC